MSTATAITMRPVTSSQISAIGHCPATETLAIQFPPKKSGVADTYHYQGVSAGMFAEFLAAESQGSFFIQRIKKFPEQFPYQKIEAAAPAPAAPVALTKEVLAALLSGREYREEMTAAEEGAAKAAGLVVIFGGSDDLMEFRGAVHNERGYYPGRNAHIDAKGLLPVREDIKDDEVLRDFFARQPSAKGIEALWCAGPEHSWTYATDIPHATFEIVEGDEKYCRGIVIDLADLAPAA